MSRESCWRWKCWRINLKWENSLLNSRKARKSRSMKACWSIKIFSIWSEGELLNRKSAKIRRIDQKTPILQAHRRLRRRIQKGLRGSHQHLEEGRSGRSTLIYHLIFFRRRRLTSSRTLYCRSITMEKIRLSPCLTTITIGKWCISMTRLHSNSLGKWNHHSNRMRRVMDLNNRIYQPLQSFSIQSRKSQRLWKGDWIGISIFLCDIVYISVFI